MAGGLQVANVTATLTGHFDDDPFDRFDRRVDRSRRNADRPIQQKLDTKVDTSGLDRYEKRARDVDRSNRDMVRGSGRVRTAFGSLFIGGAGVAGAATALYGFAKAGTAVISTASDISESISKNKVLFGDSAKEVEKFADSASKSYGISKQAALEYTGTFGNLFRALGINQKESAKYSVSLNKLAADMASFNNTSVEEALDAIRSGLVGETEPLRKFGVNMNDATLRTEALKLGLIKTTKEALDPQAKALAAQALITKQTAAAHGDFARTSGGLANQQRILSATVSNLGAKLGTALLPFVLKVVTGANKLIETFTGGSREGSRFSGTIQRVGQAISGGFSSAIKAAQRVLDGIKTVVNDNRQTFERMARTTVDNARNIWNAIKSIGRAIGDTFGGDSGAGRDIRNIIEKLLSFAATVQSVASAIVKRALPGIVTAFRGFAQVVRGVVRIIAGVLTLDFGKAWDGVKDIFGGAIKTLTGLLRAATAPFREAIAGIGRGIAAAFRTVWGGAVSLGEGFVNKIIDVINIIPGVNIKHVGGGDGVRQSSVVVTAPSKYEHGAGKFAEGGKVTMPIAIMGEEAPTHPEWVIPTNPAYRKRAVSLWAMAAKELGIPGFFDGGKFAGDAVNFAKDRLGDAANAASYAIPGVGAVRSAAGLASKLIDKLPGNPGGMLSGTWDYGLDKAKDFIKDKAKGAFSSAVSAVSGAFSGGGGGTGGLVPQVLRAIAWAKAHGWGGSVISGYRDPASQIAAAQQYAARRGMPLSALYPNGVLASNHTRGQAIDVTDPGGFRAAMAGAPAGSRLLGLVSGDPAHFSVSGHRMGGILGMIGGAFGGERLAGGTLAFKAGGKLSAARKAVHKSERTVRRHEGGVQNYESWLGDEEKVYGQMDRRFGLTEEQITVEQPDGSTTVDTKAQNSRLAELGKLRKQREKIQKKVEEYKRRVERLIADYRKAIKRVEAALKAASGKKRKKERKGYVDEIDAYKSRIAELQKIKKSLGLEGEDQSIDLAELDSEIASVKNATGVAAEPEPVKEPEAPDLSLGAALVGDEASQISALTRDQALAELTPDTGDDESVRARGENFYRALLDRLRGAGASDEAVTSAAQALKGFLPTPPDTTGGGTDGTTTPDASSPDSIAAQIATALATFNTSRADLFRTFGANFSTVDRMMNPTAAEEAAGLRHFGGGSSGTQGGALAGGGGIVQNLTFPVAPPDPHTFTQQALHELQAAL